MSFDKVLNKYRELSTTQAAKGNRFELLMKEYLLTDPTYANSFKNVWMWDEFFAKDDLGGHDTGIDLVAETNWGDYWAIQCKCYAENANIDKKGVDSFLSTSGRGFKNKQMETTRFAHRLWISTTNKWGRNATETIQSQNPPVSRINLSDLREAPVDWEAIDKGLFGEQARNKKKTLRDHQKEALNNTHEAFKTADRGKLIMACGTGKTFTSLRIAENETNGKGLVLFLVPSIALLGQTLREWSADAKEKINAICICSDAKVGRKKKNADSEEASIVDLALPASTNTQNILGQFDHIKQHGNDGMTVVFSTYQSIEVIAKAQKAMQQRDKNSGIFDLIICDEAHRTTGVTLADEDEAAFTKVHNNDFLQAKKRLYMTATSRLYSDDSKSKAALNDAVLCSMDDEAIYGKEMYRIGFGEAVEKNLLSDYKVLILTLSDQDVSQSVQDMIADDSKEINADDASKLIGCINALSKQILGDEGIIKDNDPDPMKRAVAFCPSIVASKKITDNFNATTDVYINDLPEEKQEQMISVESEHIDGTMTAPERDELLSWLKADSEKCRVLTNVRCLSEGVDVPSLDAVMFLSARNSQVDVVQSVGRVMRRAEGKKYGYIIIPVIVPSDVEPSKALDNNKHYKVVWSVLNALRAHDDRFNATVNKIELNRKRPNNILIARPETSFDQDGQPINIAEESATQYNSEVNKLPKIQFEELQSTLFARMVKKVGDRRYWEQWAKEVAEIAERQIERITDLVNKEGEHQATFNKFLKGLQQNINDSITQQQAIEMLSQHIITKPVFEALFDKYSFVKNNPISLSMQGMLDLLEANAIEKETETLQKFYDSVRTRAKGIDNSEGKQSVIIELYDKFFKTAFPKMAEQLGIVYTPVEVVDFIIHSVNDVLKQEFGRTISDENVHILDPFTGTGTFITRLLQSKLIKKQDKERKFKYELHANEIVLLAYYIAAVNIEDAYHDIIGTDANYEAFQGICLTDTFQLDEARKGEFHSDVFPQNLGRVEAQKKEPIKVIIGNPPYSIGQKNANDNAQNQAYPKLDARIANTYAKASSAGLSKSLYDAYIKAFRWSSDRLDKKHGGIICFVSNGAWLDSNSTDGFRKHLEQEFDKIFVFNLRGNQRTSGELSRKEGGKIFGSGSRTPISITMLVKNPSVDNEKAEIYYHDIGDYLNQKEKLKIIKDFESINSPSMTWKQLKPNTEGDWINQRNEVFDTFIPIQPEKKFNNQSFFSKKGPGVATGRDAFVYNFSQGQLASNMQAMIEFYNRQVEDYKKVIKINSELKVEDFINQDLTKIKWTRSLRKDISTLKYHKFQLSELCVSGYRPYCKQRLYFDKPFIESPGLSSQFFPTQTIENFVICITGVGASKDFSTLITNSIPNYDSLEKAQCFPLYYYEERKVQDQSLFDKSGTNEDKYIRRDGISDFILDRAIKQYKLRTKGGLTKEDLFYYVYGILHSPEYRNAFANDFKKVLPRIPLVEKISDFWTFSKAGRKLADLHINYEAVPTYPDVEISFLGKTGINPQTIDTKYYQVEKMRFPKKGQKDSIIYNSSIIISGIPEKAYQYVVNGKSAIEWIMERYQIKTDKKSDITNNPNDWANEVGNPSYILDLLLSIINLSVQTVDIVNSLPKLNFE